MKSMKRKFLPLCLLTLIFASFALADTTREDCDRIWEAETNLADHQYNQAAAQFMDEMIGGPSVPEMVAIPAQLQAAYNVWVSSLVLAGEKWAQCIDNLD